MDYFDGKIESFGVRLSKPMKKQISKAIERYILEHDDIFLFSTDLSYKVSLEKLEESGLITSWIRITAGDLNETWVGIGGDESLPHAVERSLKNLRRPKTKMQGGESIPQSFTGAFTGVGA